MSIAVEALTDVSIPERDGEVPTYTMAKRSELDSSQYEELTFQVNNLKEGHCVLSGPDGTARKVYVVRRKVRFTGELGCKHRSSGVEAIGIDYPMYYRDSSDGVAVMVIAELEGEESPTVMLCEGCERFMEERRARHRSRDEETTDDGVGYSYLHVDWRHRSVVSYTSEVVLGPSKKRVEDAASYCMWLDARSHVIWIGRVEFQVKNAVHDR
jgi:hypothetical protein